MNTSQTPITPKLSTSPRQPSSVNAPAGLESSTHEGSTPHTRRFRHDFYIEVLTKPTDHEGSVYLSTFQRGRGQHLTSLTRDEARELGIHLIGVAEEIDKMAGVRI